MGIFDDHSSVNRTCPNDSLSNPPQEPYGNGFTFHQMAEIVAGAFTIFACAVSGWLIFKHATHFSVPKEQKQIIRVVSLVPVFAIISFLTVAFEDTSIYLTPLVSLYEAIAFTGFFMLLCEFINPDEAARNAYFVQNGIMSRFTRASIGVFQFPVVMIVNLAATDITQATGIYCKTSDKPQFAHIWLQIIIMVSTTFAVMSVIRIYKATKSETKSRKPLQKLVCFKMIVFLNFIQTTIFSFLSSSKDLKPTKHITYNDLTEALPGLIICIEMAIFAVLFLYVHRTSEYRFNAGDPGNKVLGMGSGGYQGGALGLGAIAQALDIRDMFWAARNVLGARSRGMNYQSMAHDAIPMTNRSSPQYQNAPYQGGQYQGAQYPGAEYQQQGQPRY